MLINSGALLHGKVARHDFEGINITERERERVERDIHVADQSIKQLPSDI